MKKFWIGIGVILLLFITFCVSGWFFIFSSTGNKFLKGVIERKLQERVPVKVKVSHFKLTPNKVEIKINFKNRSFFKVNGEYSLFSRSADLFYTVKIFQLEKFENIIGEKLYGNIFTWGKLKLLNDKIFINGQTDFANGDSSYRIELVKGEISKISFNLKKLKIEKLLYFLGYPKIAKGEVSSIGELYDIEPDRKFLKGKITTTIHPSVLLKDEINREFDLNFKKDIGFRGKLIKNFHKNSVRVDGKFFTDIANITLPQLNVNLIDGNISGKYEVYLFDLRKLKNLFDFNLRGKVKLKGDFEKTSEGIKASGISYLFDGKVKFNFDKDVFNLKFKNVHSSKILRMLNYPELVRSVGNGRVVYDISKKKGNFVLKFREGKLVKSKLTFIPRTVVDIVHGITGVDLTKELYRIIDIDGVFTGDKIISNLFVKSKLAEISSKKSEINTRRETIKSVLDMKVGSLTFAVKILGKLEKPSISFKIKKLKPVKSIEKELKNLKKQFKSILPFKLK